MQKLEEYMSRYEFYRSWNENPKGTYLNFVILIAFAVTSYTVVYTKITEYSVELEAAAHQSTVRATPTKAQERLDDVAVAVSKAKESNRIIVKYKESGLPQGRTVAGERANFEKAEGLKKLFKVSGIDADVYEVSENDTAEEVVTRILGKKKDVIEYAEVDALVGPTLIPNDPYFASSWHHQKIQTPIAWDTVLGENIKVAVLDSGVSLHPDLLLTNDGWNFFDNNNNTADVYGHGTLVAGSIGAMINNGIGVTGVSPKVQIMPVRVTDVSGYGYTSTISQGITYAADHGARVANASFGGACASASIQNAATYMRSKGGIVTISAGNTGTDDGTVANGSLICVSATDQNDAKASWSSFGAYVDVAAPGTSIYTTNKSGGYSTVQGTSFSAPITGAVYALLFSANPALTSAQADSIIFSTADDLGTAGWDMNYGYGRVNATKAVTAALATVGTQDTTKPLVPANLRTTSMTSNSATLAWNASTDNVGVTGYTVYKNGTKVTTVAGTSYTNSGLTPETTYAYTVSASDAAGNESAQSTSVSVTTPVSEFSIASFSVPTKTKNSATVAVTLTKAGTVMVKYGTSAGSLNLSAQGTASGISHSVALTGLNAKTTYYYQVIATDGTGKTVTSNVSSFKTAVR